MEQKLQFITDAFGYSGKFIATRLLAEGQHICTLTKTGKRTNLLDGIFENF